MALFAIGSRVLKIKINQFTYLFLCFSNPACSRLAETFVRGPITNGSQGRGIDTLDVPTAGCVNGHADNRPIMDGSFHEHVNLRIRFQENGNKIEFKKIDECQAVVGNYLHAFIHDFI
jgi:hypothetical protein